MMLDRRRVLAALAAAACPIRGRAQDAPVSDAAGRLVVIPETVARVFPAGPPASIWLYTLAPELLLGWPRAIRREEQVYLLHDIAKRPEVGRLTGRGNTANLEVVLASKPDLILDVGSTDATYVSLADRVQAQTGIAYALLDGRKPSGRVAQVLLAGEIHPQHAVCSLAARAKPCGPRSAFSMFPARKWHDYHANETLT